MNTPNIRFKGFAEAWEQRKFEDYYKMLSGYAFKYQDYCENGVPLINGESIQHGKIDDHNLNNLPSSFVNDYPDFVLHEKDIVVGLNRPITNGNLKIARIPSDYEGALLYQRAGKIQYKKDIDIDFSYILLAQQIMNFTSREAVGSDQPFISTSKLNKWKISIPSNKDEQAKIGSFFMNFENLITLHQRKCDSLNAVKKYMLQKMFPQNGAKVPEIRFKGFTGDWEQRRLGDVCERVQGNDGRMDLPTLTISAANGWMSQEDRFFGNIAGKEQKNYTLLHRGELSYNHGNSKLAKYGTVFSLETFEEALVPRVYHSFRMTSGNASFIEYYFATKILDKELAKLISSGARMDGLLNIGFYDFMGINIIIPSTEEQARISEYLRSLDNLITLHQRKVDSLKELKKFMLQNMFP
ncbi:MAG: restriction endonuclease subunit S [Schwartzia succinivorans]|nr:restriction endonuclease subunit S [Schwartzia succinivorans]